MKLNASSIIVLHTESNKIGFILGFIITTHDPLQNRVVIRWETGDIVEYYFKSELGSAYFKKTIKIMSTSDLIDYDLKKYEKVWKRLAKL